MSDIRTAGSSPSGSSTDYSLDDEDRRSAHNSDEADDTSRTAPQDTNIPDKQAPWGNTRADVAKFLGSHNTGSDQPTAEPPGYEKSLPELPQLSERSYGAESFFGGFFPELGPIDGNNRISLGSEGSSIHFGDGESSHHSSETGNLSSPSRYSEDERPVGGTPMQAQLLARIRRDSAMGSDYSFGSKSSDERIRQQNSSSGSNYSLGSDSKPLPPLPHESARATEPDEKPVPEKPLPPIGIKARLNRTFREDKV